MKLIINGETREFTDLSQEVSVSLPDLLKKHLEIGDVPVLVELNGTALLKNEIEAQTVADGDTLEIIRMVAGG